MIERRTEYIKIASVEKVHWWYRILHKLVFNTLRDSFPSHAVKILDAGCGTGGLMLFLQERGYRDIRGLDLSADALEICRERKLKVKKGNVLSIDAVYDDTFDVVISNDVLCYLDEKQISEVMKKIYGLLCPEGIFMGNVPAFDAFRGIHDLSVGIRKRFVKSEFFKLFDPKQFRCEAAMYWPFLLSPIVFLARFFQRLKIRFSSQLEIKSDIDLSPRFLNQSLFQIASFENSFLKQKPWGSSLFFLLRKI